MAAKDYTGQKCGCWEVIERDWHPISKSHETFWKARCVNCGNIASVRKSDLDKQPSSCNNCKGDFSKIAERKKYNIKPGDVFGYLTVLERPHTPHKLGLTMESNTKLYVKCRCVYCMCEQAIYQELIGTVEQYLADAHQ